MGKKTYILVSKNDNVEGVGFPEPNCVNTPEKQAILDDNGAVYLIEADDVCIGDKYKNGVQTKNSPKRQEHANAKAAKEANKASGKSKLVALGLTSEEIEALTS